MDKHIYDLSFHIQYVLLIHFVIYHMYKYIYIYIYPDWIAEKYKELAANKKKLQYTVNAVLSSKKYRPIFAKDQMINNGQRALWKLAPNYQNSPLYIPQQQPIIPGTTPTTAANNNSTNNTTSSSSRRTK